MEAYTVALKCEPDSKSSRNYLEKSANDSPKSWPVTIIIVVPSVNTALSFSVISEWDKKGGGGSNHHHGFNISSSSSQPYPTNQTPQLQQQPSQTFSPPEKQSSVSKASSSSSSLNHPVHPDEREAEKYNIKRQCTHGQSQLYRSGGSVFQSHCLISQRSPILARLLFESCIVPPSIAISNDTKKRLKIRCNRWH
jgi:hypothetical protein